MTGGWSWRRVAKRIRVPAGFLMTVVFLSFAHPSLNSLLLSTVPVSCGLVLRGYASGYVRKNAELATSGPYAYTRNPLYLGSFLISLGFAAAAANMWLAAGLVALFALIYIPTIQGEETYLRATFTGFNAYAAEVPRLFPKLTASPAARSRGTFSAALYRQHREYNCLAGAGALYLALIIRLVLDRQAFSPALYLSR